jgi:hypothetical protein
MSQLSSITSKNDDGVPLTDRQRNDDKRVELERFFRHFTWLKLNIGVDG